MFSFNYFTLPFSDCIFSMDLYSSSWTSANSFLLLSPFSEWTLHFKHNTFQVQIFLLKIIYLLMYSFLWSGSQCSQEWPPNYYIAKVQTSNKEITNMHYHTQLCWYFLFGKTLSLMFLFDETFLSHILLILFSLYFLIMYCDG